MELGLRGKVAVVTGGSRGIGKAIVLDLAREGCRVAFSAREPEALRATGQEAANLGVRVLAVQADMTKPADIERLFTKTMDTLGRVDILVNNVGGSLGGTTWETSDEDWTEMMHLNLLAAVRMSRHVIPVMRQHGWGRIINISSIYGRESGGSMTYNAVKSGIISWSKSLARQLAKDGIMVNLSRIS
jgi:3-oxoacyl-[acyl-carrier protein] reductase